MGPLADARRLFRLLADSGLAVAKRMVAVAIGEAGDCFLRLHRLDEAEAALSESYAMLQKLGNVRSAVVYKAGIAKVRDCQRRYEEALELYREVLNICTALGEPGRVGDAWYRIGIVCQACQMVGQSRGCLSSVSRDRRAGKERCRRSP